MELEFEMSESEQNPAVEIDAKTSSAIVRGIGERLRSAMPTDAEHPALLQRLLDELARQDRAQQIAQAIAEAASATNH